uniref:ANK_REP_REGION domain-containing protein n=1 Tax=Caenorhabditis japonica TaxID=281687 RepID=A0A8R1E5D5_CAEJA
MAQNPKNSPFQLQIGADPSVRGCVEFDNDNIKGTPPLWAASAAGHLGIVKLLVEQANADVNQATNTQSTPLRGACYDGHLDIVKYLLEHGADPHLPNRHGHTCLMIASYRNKVGIVEELLSFGVDVNKQTERGNSALHDAAESGNIEVVNLLFEHGAKMVKDLHGVDPLICAAQSGCPEVLEVLKQHEPSAIRRRDALKLIGATFMDKKMDAMAAMDYWRQAMDVELSEDDQKIVSVFLKVFMVYKNGFF